MCFDLIWKNFEYLIHTEVTVRLMDVNIQDLTVWLTGHQNPVT